MVTSRQVGVGIPPTVETPLNGACGLVCEWWLGPDDPLAIGAKPRRLALNDLAVPMARLVCLDQVAVVAGLAFQRLARIGALGLGLVRNKRQALAFSQMTFSRWRS